jgi:hypothetical protein
LGGARDERIGFALRVLAPLLDGRLRLGDISPDLAREAQAAAGETQATLILPPGPGPARIDLGTRQVVIPAALRDALVAALAGAGTAAAGTATQAPVAAARKPVGLIALPTQSLVATAPAETASGGSTVGNALAASGTLRAVRNEATRDSAQPIAFSVPVLDRHDAAVTAERLAGRVAGSGLFFESHVVQWARGERAQDALQAEAQSIARGAAADPARAEARSAVQLDALQRQAITLAGPAWEGQPMQLELGRDPHGLHDAGAGPAQGAEPVFVARLRLDLPRLGPIEVRLRLAGETVGASIESGGTQGALAQLAAALPEFASALAARGLRPVLVQASRAGEEALAPS